MGRRPSWARRYIVPALVASLIASLGTPPLPAVASTSVPQRQQVAELAAPELGGQLFSSGQPVEVQVLPASAGFTSELWLFEPAPARRIATNRDVGLVVQLGAFPSGVELLFGIVVLNTGETFKMGPGSRNPDGIPHAVVNFLEPGRAQVGFEDLFGGGDRDYNDNMFEFRGGIIEEPPSGPTANAGPDQTVDEGAVVTLDGTGSTDPDSQNLTYSWALTSHVGPPITLSSSTAAKPTFQTADDGTYDFTLTVSDGTTTDTDEVRVTVRNKVPVLAAQADPAYAGSVALVTTSFTDAGILDTHGGTLNWGDGSASEAFPVSAQGTGWGTLVASHVYATAGSYTVTVTITDDDGGSATTTLAGFQVIVPVALWANSSTSDTAMETTSGAVTVVGLTHTNDDLRIRGGAKSFTGPTEYVRTLDVGGTGATFNPAPVKTAIKQFPIVFAIADYRPGGRAAIEAGPAYHNMSSSCGTDGFWHVTGSTLASGIYYATCGVKLNGNPIGGTITVAAEGEIHVSGTGAFFDPYIDGLLFISYSTTTNAIRVDASGSTFLGYLFAQRGRIVLSGADDKFFCGILGDQIDIAAQNLRVQGSGCSRPARTIAPPTIVPNLAMDVTVDKTDVLPGQSLTHTATVSNGGATLVVPGVIGIENLGTVPVTVAAHTLGLEYQSALDGTWHPLPGTVTITVRPNAIAGVAYPSGTERIDGTVAQPGKLASWGYAAVVQLTAAQVAFILDPAQVRAVRNVSTFDITPSGVPVRRLFRFGDDFIAQIRSLGANATNVIVTIVPPAGDAATFNGTTTPALAVLTPGESVAVQKTSTAPAPAARAADESDAAYLARLAAFDATLLVGIGFARGTAGIGPVLAPADAATSTRHLPVVGLDKTGPASIEAGTAAQYSLGLANTGSAEARQIVLTDVVSGVGARPVSGAPATLAPAATATATASYPVPANATQSVVNTGTVTWSDLAGNAYGPLNDALTSVVIAPRKLAVVKTDVTTAGANPGEISYEIAVTNLGDQSVSNVVVTDTPDALTSLIVGSVTTTAGTVTTGNTAGDTTVAVSIGTLAGRTTQVVSFDVSVGFIPEGVAAVSNQATVTSTELPSIVSDDPGQPGATDPTITPVGPTAGGGGGGGGGGGEARPVIGAPTPVDGSVVTEAVTISTEITPPEGQSVASWKITASQAGTTGETTLATGTGAGIDEAVTASADFDPTKLPNGTYLITIRSTASGGGIQVSTTSLVVDGNLKLGRYKTTYQDLSVGIAGLPMQVRRTYDSFDKAVGDFGVGWNVDLANFRVSVNKPLGYGGWVQETFGCGFIFCQTRYHSTTPHTVTVVWPDGHQEIFDMQPANGSTFFGILTASGFTGRARTTSTLQADGDTGLSYFGDGNLYGGGFGSGGIFDPQRFRLTAKDGTVYVLDRTSGLVSSTDRNGNTLTVSAGGITSSLGPSITFTRDSQGRITKIVGPEDETLLYTYDAAGDLKTFTDANSRVLSYTYDGAHNLTLTKDPLNRPFQTLTYEDGRLASVTDALGNDVAIDVDPDARTERVTDAEGRLTTISTLDARGNVLEKRELFDGKTAITTFEYDAFDNVKKRTDPNGKTWLGIYDEQELRFLTDPTGNTTEIRYDDFGYPVLWKQPRGGETEYQWTTAGQLERIVDTYEKAETYTYEDGNRKTRTDREGHTWTYAYFTTGKLRSVTDPLTHTTEYTYDDSGRLLSEKDATNRTTTYTYWPDGNLKSITAPGSLVTSYTYNEFSLLATKTDPAGKTTTWQYDLAGRVKKVIDPLGHETSYTYDANGRTQTMTAADTGVTTYTYDGAGRVATVRDPIGRVTTRTYDLGGRLASSLNPADGLTEFGYDNAGRETLVRDPLGNEIKKTYDDDGNLETVLDPRTFLTRFEYDLADRQVKTIDGEDGETITGYDFDGRISSITNPEDETTASAYDPAGRISSVTDDLGHTTSYGYDNAGRLLTTRDALGHTETRAYDAAGRLQTLTTASGISTTYTYDPRGMIATIANAIGHTRTKTYDADGRLTTERDPRGFTTTYGYDAVDRLTSIKDQKNAVVTFGYDLAGQQTSIKDARNKTWTATYDALGGIRTTVDPLGRDTLSVYNKAGQLEEKTDARDFVSEYEYDASGNLQSVSASGIAISYAYDGLNRRTRMSDGRGDTIWNYDGASRLTSAVTPTGTVGYAYDDAGRRTGMTLPTGSVTYGYFDDNRLATLTAPGVGTFNFTYLADGRAQTVSRPNGVTTTDGYDAAGRLTSITHAKSGATLASYAYVLDENGNRRSVTSAGGTESYTLNELNQLTRVTLPGGGLIDYTYDAAGNRLTKAAGGATTTYTYDDASQLTAVGGSAYTYDASGNRTAGGGSTYTYDSLGRLTGAATGGAATTYAIDGDGRRLATTTGGTTTSYLWDVVAPYEQVVSDGSRTYLRGNGMLLAEQSAGSIAYPLADAIGSVRTITDATGAVTGTAAFDAFGATTARSGTTSIYGYAGEIADPAGVYLRARAFDPVTGVFTQTDPLRPGAAGVVGYNQYSYVGNNPTTLTDPSGTMAIASLAIRLATIPPIVLTLLRLGLVVYSALLAVAVCLSGAIPLCDPRTRPWERDDPPTTVPRVDDRTVPRTVPRIVPRDRPWDKPKIGWPVYRVWDGIGAFEFGKSWTPINPLLFSSETWRNPAGLPDRLNGGTMLTSGVLTSIVGVIPRLSLPMAPPLSYCEYNGGMAELVILNAETKVLGQIPFPLAPPYGGRPMFCPDGSIPPP